MADKVFNKKGIEMALNQLLVLIFIVIVILLAFFVFYKIIDVKDIIINMFG